MREERMKIRAAKAGFCELVNRVRHQQAKVVVTNHGKPVAVVLSFEEHQRLLGANVVTPSGDAQLKSA